MIPRHAQRSVSDALADNRVVVLNGARQTGKSTLARIVAAVPGSELRYLDEDAVRAAAQADPSLRRCRIDDATTEPMGPHVETEQANDEGGDDGVLVPGGLTVLIARASVLAS